MSIYCFASNDRADFAWLIHKQDLASGRRAALAEYEKLVCSRCRRFSPDEVFKVGFAAASPLKAKEDIILTDDGFYCVNERFRKIVAASGTPGLEFKQVGKTEWNVIKISHRYDVPQDVFKTVRGSCDTCGRIREMIGGVLHEGQFIVRPAQDSFFSTNLERQGSGGSERDLYATGKVVELLKSAGLKGGVFRLLHDEATYRTRLAAWHAGKKLKDAKGSFIHL